ncbi:MAG: FKBP-type peptidyl-prolyl cis-trans isomerase [Chitinophagaceae bacterium]
MKRFILMAGFVSLVFAGCKKTTTASTCTPVEPSTEEPAIVAFNTLKGYTATKLPSGIYYQIVNPGTGAQPTATSNVRAQYVGKLFDGTTFDSNYSLSGASFNLSGVIQGWTIGVPLIKSGGTIRLMIPSKLAYGCSASGSVPANAPLFFEITLLSVF